MAELSLTTQKRITFLSVFQTLEGDYKAATETVASLEEDGFFDAGKPSRPSRGRNETSNNRGSSSRQSNRGGGGQGMRDPDGPPTDKQVTTVLKNTDDYSEDELYDMTKEEVSNLIDDLFNG
jgi:hypothetical protein